MTKTIGFAMIVTGAAWWVLAAGAAEPPSQPATQPSTQPAKEFTLDLGNKVTMKLVQIPAGKFLMGSPNDEKGHRGDEGPRREVTISKPFYIGVYEVTQEQYEQVMGNNPSDFKGPTKPVDSVSWDDAVEFCKKLSQKTGKTARLPTEAQWEHACRAGSKTRFCCGDDDDEMSDYAWHFNNGKVGTHEVGQKKPNAFGLYDMHGNIWEWCGDWYANSYANAKNVDPTGPDSGSYRVLRGGSRSGYPDRSRSAVHVGRSPDLRNRDFGFRVALDLK